MTPALLMATAFVHPDEPCYLLSELEEKAPDENGWRRVQKVYVNRDGRMAVYVRDMGPAADCQAPQFRVCSLWEDSVAYCMDQADRQRWGDDYWQRFLAEKAGESTLVQDAVRFVEEGARLMRNQSVFGPAVSRQRNLFVDRAKVNRKVTHAS